MVVADGRNGKNGKLKGKDRIKITGVMSSFYKQRLHLFHFPHSWEVGGPSGRCGVLVFNNYRRKERLHSYPAHLFTQPSDNMPGCLVTSHINVARCFFQNNK